MFNSTTEEWANSIFGNAELGDSRRTDRLVKFTTDMANHAGNSVVSASEYPASVEAAYRLIRNHAVRPEHIALSGFKFTDTIVKERPLVLAIQDTTGLSYRHSICDKLGNASSAKKSAKNPQGRSLFVHSTLMMDADSEQILGLGNQYYWFREQKNSEKKEVLQQRPIEEKESYKWQQNIETLSARMGSLSNVIDVCDREADIYEYLDYQKQQGNRFLVRAKENRKLNLPKGCLNDAVKTMSAKSHYTVHVPQKGGRKARDANVALSYRSITINKPKRATGSAELTVNMIVCQEVNAENEDEKLCWVLYTSEPITSDAQARKLVRFYELRWRVEDFHKVWKSDGTQVEKLKMQGVDNLKRVAIVQAFIAIRLMQLQQLIKNKEAARNISCERLLPQLLWKLLWKKIEKKTELPQEPPSLYWAYYAIAKIGGWYDSKRTGQVGVKAIWVGWKKIMIYAESLELIQALD
ncbi:hypothetical protein C2869_16560 [Saccharobesus litoralis]|uniref:Transposase n=1 Tax=Saccharobesus litoralis TaxID=2172099 RepID=A0A2S0VUN2_9ALTE|nr:IS4 family transposase [Saccharobesus litoralis]AWB66159.1 hypothetical protein C2869_06785 [Saccharobesus litoralis]AWB67936.1 hypothetical protein C2869_16560 [Saccharobesus litoralis]